MARKWTVAQRANFRRTMKAKRKGKSNGPLRGAVPPDFERALGALVEQHVRRILEDLLRGRGI